MLSPSDSHTQASLNVPRVLFATRRAPTDQLRESLRLSIVN